MKFFVVIWDLIRSVGWIVRDVGLNFNFIDIEIEIDSDVNFSCLLRYIFLIRKCSASLCGRVFIYYVFFLRRIIGRDGNAYWFKGFLGKALFGGV